MCKFGDVEAPAANADEAKAASSGKRGSEISRFAISDLFFHEIVPTLLTANKRRLEPPDVAIDHDVAVDQYEKFAESWQAEQTRAEKLKAQLAAEAAKEAAEKSVAEAAGAAEVAAPEASDVQAAEKKSTGEKKKEKKKPAEPKPRIGRALLPLLGLLQPISALLYAVDLGLKYASPFLLQKQLELIFRVQFCRDPPTYTIFGALPPSAPPSPPLSPDLADDDQCEGLFWGYFMAFAIFLARIIGSFCLSHSEMLATRASLRVRSAIMCALYRKCLRLAGIQNESTGQIQNLMSNDAQFFVMIAPQFNSLWASPVQVIIAIIWLATLVGWSLLVGVGIILVCIPLQGKIVKKLFMLRAAQLKFTDERIKLVNEMVQGMRVIKLSGWEPSIMNRIAAVRHKELKTIRETRAVSAIFSTMLVGQPLFISVSVFTTYAALGNSLQAATVITALLLLTMLRFPLVFMPFLAFQLVNLRVSLTRVQRFLLNKELTDVAMGRAFSSKKQPVETETAGAHPEDVKPVLVGEAERDSGSTLSGMQGEVLLGAQADAASGDQDRPVAALHGTFRWQPPDVPAGKGKGKGKGRGGKGRGGGRGAQAEAGGAPGAGGQGSAKASSKGRGRGGGEATLPAEKKGFFKKSTPTVIITSELPPEKKAPDAPSDVAPSDKEGAAAATPANGETVGGKAANGAASDVKPVVKEIPNTLLDLDLDIARGKLTMVAGAVGCGKSSLLSALLGELQVVGEGRYELNGQRLAYASQTPFVASDTLRGNILFGEEMDEDWYNQVVHACALRPDLDILAGGDMTQIGEKGVNLSGGQKARVTLARAVYARADIVLLDDPLSAVDAHVGRHLFRHVLGPNGLLANATRVLVTHQTQFLPHADDVLILDAGRVVAHGSYEELKAQDGTLAALQGLSSAEDDGESPAEPPEGPASTETPISPETQRRSGGKTVHFKKTAEDEQPSENQGLSEERSVVLVGDEKKEDKGARLVELEERQTGSVPAKVYLAYIKAAGGWPYLILLLTLLCMDRGATTFVDVWLAEWIESDDSDNLSFYIPIYCGAVVGACILVYLRSILTMVVMGVRASKNMHEKLLGAILAAPTLFFETTPSGRILNRFTADTEMLDSTLLQNLQQWLNCIMPIISALVLVAIVNWWVVGWFVPLAGLYVLLYRFSVAAVRDLQRLEAVSRSPIFSQFSETLAGLSTIRAFGAGGRFQASSEALVTTNNRCFYAQYLLSNWVSLSLDLMASSVVFMSMLLPILTLQTGSTVEVALVGVSITFSLELSQFLKHATRMTLEVQKSFAGVERVVEYIDCVPSEDQGGAPTPEGWPPKGSITLSKLSVRYRPELPPALSSVSCVIPAQAKVGVVGRTGSGKSTFLAALWRLVEAEGGLNGDGFGAIYIDGVDIRGLKLPALRSKLAIIPQDPILFNDSLRYNLDPFSERSDTQHKEVIELVQLSDTVNGLPQGLDHPISEGGANFSVGQRQLICLARATLRHAVLLALDEATASIDNETDALLQTAIRSMFEHCTVLTIAHRLHTIMDSSHIMLFDQGQLREFASPQELLSDPSSSFSQLVEQTGSAASHLRRLSSAAALAVDEAAEAASPAEAPANDEGELDLARA